MNEPFQYMQPGAAGASRSLPASRRFPRMPWWLGQILPAPRPGVVPPPGRRGTPLPRFLVPVVPQADRSPPVGSLPDRLPGRGETRQRLEARGGKRERHRTTVLNTQFNARRYGAPLPTASTPLVNSIMPLSPVLPASRAWHSIRTDSGTVLQQRTGDSQPLPAHSEFRGQSASGTILLHQPSRPQAELEDDGHREYSIELAR